MSTFEARSKRDAAEELATSANVRGAQIGSAPGGEPELSLAERSSLLAGSGDEFGEMVALYRYAEYHSLAGQIARSLHEWGLSQNPPHSALWDRRIQDEHLALDAMLAAIQRRIKSAHLELCKLAVHEIEAGMDRHQRAKAVGMGAARWSRVQRHYDRLRNRLADAESTAIEHYRRQLQRVRERLC